MNCISPYTDNPLVLELLHTKMAKDSENVIHISTPIDVHYPCQNQNCPPKYPRYTHFVMSPFFLFHILKSFLYKKL